MAERPRSGRSFWPTVLLGAAASALAAVAAGRTWATARSAVGGESTEAAVAGSDVAPLALALALVGLASWGALLVLRRRARRVVAVLGLVASVAVAVIAATSAADARDRVAELVLGEPSAGADLSAWFFLTPAAGVLAAAAFGAAVVLVAAWPEMSGRYDAPAPRSGEEGPSDDSALDETDLWRALDDGRDPTA